MEFADSLNGWACGDSGIVLHTSNGGQVWERQSSTVNIKLEDVFFWDVQNGWIACDSGTVIHTTDGGFSWSKQQTPVTSLLHNIQFVTPQIGYASGEKETSISTLDGGVTWQASLGSDSGTASIVFFWIDEARGTMIFSDPPSTLQGHTVDGGMIWYYTGIPPGYFNGVYDVYGYRAYNINFYWDVGNQGRIAWIFVIESAPTISYSLVGQADDTLDLYAVTLERLEPLGIEPLKLWAVGQQVWIINSVDSGQTWQTIPSNVSIDLYEVSFPVKDRGWIVGNSGTILYTSNGGVPVELISFIADVLNNKVLLRWATSTEINNQGFEIERSRKSEVGGRMWEKIGYVSGYGTTTERHIYSFTDESVTGGVYYYRIKQIDFDGSFEYSKIVEVFVLGPKEFYLEQNYPNPFNPLTTIKYDIVKAQDVKVFVYDILGREVANLVNEQRQPGSYEVKWDASNVSSGIYFYQLKTKDYVDTKKMILLK